MRRGTSLRRCLLVVRAMSDAIAKAQRYRERAGECRRLASLSSWEATPADTKCMPSTTTRLPRPN
jgi:hypothetical protein